MRVRRGTADDADAITAVRNASWRAAYGAHIPDSYWDEFDSARFAEHTATAISTGRWEVFVAESDTVVGYVLFGPCRDDDTAADTREIYAIYVHPEAWSTGAGRALMTAALDALGDVTVVLWVLEQNARARRFYGLAGFAPDGAAKAAEMPGGDVPELRYRRG